MYKGYKPKSGEIFNAFQRHNPMNHPHNFNPFRAIKSSDYFITAEDVESKCKWQFSHATWYYKPAEDTAG